MYSPRESTKGVIFSMFTTTVANLILRYSSYLIQGLAPEFPSEKYHSVKDLCIDVLRKFSRNSLISAGRGIGAGAVSRPVEALYRNEFYRACAVLLGDVYLTPEWGGQSLGGVVDFQIKAKKWAIECVRDGDQLTDHIERFQEEGIYYKWITSGEIQEYIILDFRKGAIPRKSRGMIMFCLLFLWNANRPDNVPLLFIVYSDKLFTYDVYDAQLNQVGETTSLLK